MGHTTRTVVVFVEHLGMQRRNTSQMVQLRCQIHPYHRIRRNDCMVYVRKILRYTVVHYCSKKDTDENVTSRRSDTDIYHCVIKSHKCTVKIYFAIVSYHLDSCYFHWWLMSVSSEDFQSSNRCVKIRRIFKFQSMTVWFLAVDECRKIIIDGYVT